MYLLRLLYCSASMAAKQVKLLLLLQSYIVCELGDKMDLLWSFIKNHLKKKMLIFSSSCKQVTITSKTVCFDFK